MDSKEKIRLIKDYIAVEQGEMSKLFFCKLHNVNFREFTKIAYVIEAELVAENERLKEENRWIPVSERLPKSPTQYLCCYYPYSGELPQMYFATTWSKAKGFFLEDGRRVFPTHWKPIILPDQALKESKHRQGE